MRLGMIILSINFFDFIDEVEMEALTALTSCY